MYLSVDHTHLPRNAMIPTPYMYHYLNNTMFTHTNSPPSEENLVQPSTPWNKRVEEREAWLKSFLEKPHDTPRSGNHFVTLIDDMQVWYS